ncbi:ureidoglycolate lyase [Acuticoccus sp. MNP-M23]|uniref:ureidoglycolate lyase n=1 Tax=Acuticoccus sp. MNP-M23 TaxID=3072793 RepID=UPI0028158E38|nr:ureidoglycolate lyase [Acuticoccus sp. MNP-M23]WMS43548.1 ureidoglycolate lyase [Acuticoccus sp. MNP-M23]
MIDPTATLQARAATAENFAPFGAIVPAPAVGDRIPLPLSFDGEPTDGEARMSLNSVLPPEAAVPLTIERHPFSVQVFVPLGDEPLLVVAAPPEIETPGAGDFTAFAIPPRHAVIYRVGTWHLGMASQTAPTTVAGFIRRIADGSDTEIRQLEGAFAIVV